MSRAPAARRGIALKQQLAKKLERVPVIGADSALWQLAQHLVPIPKPMPAPDYTEIDSPRALAPPSTKPPRGGGVPVGPVPAPTRFATAMVLAHLLAAASTDGWRAPEPGYAAGGRKSGERRHALQAARRELVGRIYWGLPRPQRNSGSLHTAYKVHDKLDDLMSTLDPQSELHQHLQKVTVRTIAEDLRHVGRSHKN